MISNRINLNAVFLFKILSLFLVCVLFISCSVSTPEMDSPNIEKLETPVLEFSVQQLENTILELNKDPDKFPTVTDPNTGNWQTDNKRNWTSGFFPGCLWLIYKKSDDEYWKVQAEKWTLSLEEMKNYNHDHDIGFRMMTSFGNAFSLTGKNQYREILFSSAETLASRYDPEIKGIKSWDAFGNYPIIIDSMMNLELLFWASEESDNRAWFEIARKHAITVINYHLRADGSTYHVVDFNKDGSVKWKGTTQGYSSESTWSRGQAWGIYGFTITYKYTEEQKFLDIAETLASYFIENLPENGIPFYDFEDPAIPEVNRDASAASIAASAFYKLGRLTSNEIYLETAERIMSTLSSPPYLAKDSNGSSILKKSTQHKGDPERGAIYADYYFLETLLKSKHY